ncbi:MAG: hypothetical protein QXU40_01440 [Candidatus Pacearchaeota archaeon]
MCAVTTKDVRPVKIKKPMIVYTVKRIEKNVIQSFFFPKFTWEIDKVMVDPLFFYNGGIIEANTIIKHGWFHSLPFYLARKMYKLYGNSVLFEAEIPVGSLVIKDGILTILCNELIDEKRVYLSNQLILRRIISRR